MTKIELTLSELHDRDETHFIIVQDITTEVNKPMGQQAKVIRDTMRREGTGGLFMLASRWTDEFWNETKDREWNGEWLEELWDFIAEKFDLK